MKKLTWALWSLMLLLCTGVAFAQTEAPTFSPDGSNEVSYNGVVTISCATQGAKIYYTIDGTEPTNASTEYKVSAKPRITGHMTIKAIAYNGDAASSVSTATFNKVKPNTPAFSPKAGSVLANAVVTISCEPAAAKIYYTTDGNAPTDASTEYTEGITIDATKTIKAIAYYGEGENAVASAVATGAFTVIEPLGLPTFTPASGEEVIYGTKVSYSIQGAPSGTKYYATTNGKDPNPSSAIASTSTAIKGNYTLKVIAVNDNVQSSVATAQYTCKLSETSFLPAPADDLKIKQGTKIKCGVPEELEGATGLTNFWFIYATGEGTDPITTDAETLQAVADAVENAVNWGYSPTYPYNLYGLDYKVAYVCDGAIEGNYKWYFPAEAPKADGTFKIRGRVVTLSPQQEPVYGDMMTATYTVEGEGIDDALPTFKPAAGSVAAATEVTLAPGENGDVVFFVVDGDEKDLTAEGFDNFRCFLYSSAVDASMDMPYSKPITIYEGHTIKAASVQVIGFDETDGFIFGQPSDVATAAYTVEGGDQAGKLPTLTVSPVKVNAADVADGMTIEFSCTADKKDYADGVGFVIRGKMGAVASLKKLEYRLSNDGAWIDFGEEIGALNGGEVIAAVPDENATDDFELTGSKTVYYRMTLQAVADEGGIGGWGDFAAGDEGEGGEGDNPEDAGTVVMPVIAFDLGYLDASMGGKQGYPYMPYNTYTPLARTPLDIQVVPAAPTFEPASGAMVDFGAKLEISCATEDALIYYTTNGEDPDPDKNNGEYYSSYWGAQITASTIKAVAVLDGVLSEVAPATYTINPIKASLSLVPMKEDTVGKNVGTGVEFSINGWEEYPATVYYTLDGTTVPSKEAFEAQADKVNGAIKKLAVEWEEYEEYGETYRNIVKTDGHALAITFDKATRLKAIGYITLAGQNVVTPVLDTMLQIKSEAKPTFSFVEGKMIKAGDKLVIENPNNIGVRPEAPEYPENPTEENLAAWNKELDAWKVEMEKYNALADATPATTLYFSFDGTQPTSAAYGRQPEDKYEEWSVFMAERTNVTILFKKDEKGLFAHVPYITGSFPTAADTIRIENGKFAVQALAVTTAAAEEGEEGEEGEGGVMLSAKGSDEEAAFMYASDFASAEYALLTLPATVTKPTFVPAPAAGALAKGDVIKWTMDAAYQAYQEEGLVAVAYVVNGSDADLTIDEAKLEKLMQDKATGYTGYRQDGKVYLYEAETDAFPIEKASEVKARQIVAIAYEIEAEDPDAEPEVKIEFKLSEIETASYTVDASKLAKPTFKTPIAGSTVEPKSPITFEMPFEYNWSAYTNLAYILYVENNDQVKLEGTAEEIMNVVQKDPTTDAKAGEPGYKVVECALMGDDLNWTKALIETEEGALTIRARLAGITSDDKVFYSDEITVSCTVAKGGDVDPGTDDPQLPATVKTPTFVPAAGAVDKGQAITWTWDEAYNEETYPMIAVAYVVNGTDADLDITIENFNELWEASQEEDENTVRKEGETYLYRTDVDDAYPYHIEKACTVKARMLIGVANIQTGKPAIKLSEIVEAAYTLKGETPAVAKPTFDPVAGEVKKGTKVTVSCETEGAVIYYTVDGSVPTDKSTKYEAAIEINEAMTVKAIAIKGDAKSEVAEAAYTILTANEDLELAGVTVYPNPSNGLFNIELPVAATVEVFASNGVLVQRMKLGEGNATLNIERSGIYFLRITGEGRTAIKRVIVR